MIQLLVLFLAALLQSQVECNFANNPRTLVDEVRQQLEDLKSMVRGNILVANSDLKSIENDFLNHGNTVIQEGVVSIEQEAQVITNQLNTVKELANSNGADISSCTDVREELLLRLPASYIDYLKSCIFEKNREEAALILNAIYLVDIAMTTVHSLEFQFRQCREDLLCLAPLINTIELNKMRLPQNIKTEVLAVETFVNRLKLSLDECSDSNVSEYTAKALSLLNDITSCVNDILG